MARRLRIAAVGEVDVDVYVERGLETLGGCSCNLARAATAAGADAALYSVVGDDTNGARVRSWLGETALELRVQRAPGATATQQIRVGADGERQLCGWAPGVVASYVPTPDELAELARFDVLALADTPAWNACLAVAGPKKVADFSQDADTAWRFTDLDLAFIGGKPDDLDRLRPYARDLLIVLTAGAAGAWALSGTTVLHQPTLARDIVDTTGCGDAFQGAFCATYFAAGDLAGALAAGALAAAAAAARWGA